MKRIVVILFTFLGIQISNAASPTPLVIWHGMGDTCCNPLSMGRIMRLIEGEIPGIYIHSIEIGDSFAADTLNGFLMPVPQQIDEACNAIKADANLQNGFNAMGFSQGGQFLRAIVEQCDGVKVHNLISIGGQHQGVYGFPNCMGDDVVMCDYVRRLLNLGAYRPVVQDHLVQAEYWHDPIHEDRYRADCIFLPLINNENIRNQTYINRMNALSNFVMVKFLNDTMVQPQESEWFGFYAPGTENEILPLQQTDLYKNDQLGLKTMDEAGKLKFLATLGEHLQFSNQWFIDNIIPYLN